MYIAYFFIATIVCAFFYKGIRIVRPTERGLVESFGRYKRFIGPGLHWVTPIIRQLNLVNVTEQMIDIDPQLVMTSDNVNAVVDVQLYLRVKPAEQSVKAALYNSDNYYRQTLNLARSILKNIVGTMPLHLLSSEREHICSELRRLLEIGTVNWGVEIIRAEIKELEFPRDIQENMNMLIKAQNEKKAAFDFAAAAEKAADGIKHADIKKAEGKKQAKLLAAEAEAKAIRMICTAAQPYFSGNNELLRVLEAAETALHSTVIEHVTGTTGSMKSLADIKASTEKHTLISTE